MNRNLEAILFRAHESRMSSLRGFELPKGRPDCLDETEARALAREERRKAVLTLCAEGFSAREIAKRLGLSEGQVRRAVAQEGQS